MELQPDRLRAVGNDREKLSGTTFEEFLGQRFFRPLGMTSTRYGDAREIVPGRASLYTRIESCNENGPKLANRIYSAQPAYLYPSYMHTGAGINTSVEDLVKWNLALDEAKVLQQKNPGPDVVCRQARGRPGLSFRRHHGLCPRLGRRRSAGAQIGRA